MSRKLTLEAKIQDKYKNNFVTRVKLEKPSSVTH